ncbi:MAG: beta-ketoacyl synthase chain length factor [Rhodanobacteraceae bacterium]
MSMRTLTVWIEGIGLWAPGIADWAHAVRVFAGAMPDENAVAKPTAAALPPAERRRAPEPVLIASEAAGQACAMAGIDPAELACVFASTHGDLAITDTMCTTLAADPRELSPIRFHNSVHNAPSGYWTVATHCHAAATAISAADGTFAAGLLEAALQVETEGAPVLLVAYDIAARGPLGEVATSTSPFAVAFVLGSKASSRASARLTLRHADASYDLHDPPAALAALTGNPTAAQALPLLLALAEKQSVDVMIPAGAGTSLVVEVSP